MGNKSKTRKRAGKWKALRDALGAQLPRATSGRTLVVAQWGGLPETFRHQKPPRRRVVARKGDFSGVPVDLPPAPAALTNINETPQPWQKAAAKRREKLKTKPHMGWNDRRIAREARLTKEKS